MTDLLHDVDAPSDAELISRVRGGDVAAYGELFSRHVDAAKRLSRQLVRGPDADDLVSEAFAKVLTVLQGGGGPDVAFRAYLLTAVRRLHVDRIRAASRLQTSDDMESFDPGVPFQDTAVAAFESGAAARAFASLPERWQLVLWHLEVEGQKPADVAPLLGMSPNSVSALAYRAREGLRQAFLTMHLSDISETDCRWVNEHLGAYVRNGLAKRDSAKVQSHLDDCRRCTAMYLELSEVNSDLRAIIGPLLLGAAATGYLASTGTVAGGLGIGAVFGRVRDTITANAGAATVGAVAAGVAAVATAGILLLPSSGPDPVVGADEPIGTVSSPGEPAGSGTSKPGNGPKNDPSASAGSEAASPAAILASELPSVTDQPVGLVAGDTGGPSTGEQPAGTDPGGTGGQEGPTAPSGSTSTEPSPTAPSPTEPSPTAPNPTAPSPTGPSPTAPSPTEPSPTAPSPTAPSPTVPTPPNPPPVTYLVVAGPASIENGQISFDLTGDPQLPPALVLDLRSAPVGIAFGSDGTCRVRAADTTVADCDTTPLTALASLPFARTMLADTIQRFPITMPLVGTPIRDTVVTVVVRDGKGAELAQTQGLYKVAPPTADVSLTLPPAVTTDNVHEYAVTATVFGVPNSYAGRATFTLTSAQGPDGPRATFVGDETCAASADGLSLDCATIANGALPLTIYVKDNSVDTAVTVRMDPLSGLDDPVATNNGASTTLKARRPSTDVKLSASFDPDGNAGKGSITAVVQDAPVDGATLTAAFDPADVIFSTVPNGCVTDSGVITCSAGPGIASLTFDVALVDRPGHFADETVSFSAAAPASYLETNSADNHALVVIPRSRGNTSQTQTAAQLRTTASDVLPSAPSLVDGGAGLPTGGASDAERATKKANLLLNLRATHAPHAKHVKPPRHAVKQAGAATTPGAAKGKPADLTPAGMAPAVAAGDGNGNGNGDGPAYGRGNGTNSPKKIGPHPGVQAVDEAPTSRDPAHLTRPGSVNAGRSGMKGP